MNAKLGNAACVPQLDRSDSAAAGRRPPRPAPPCPPRPAQPPPTAPGRSKPPTATRPQPPGIPQATAKQPPGRTRHGVADHVHHRVRTRRVLGPKLQDLWGYSVGWGMLQGLGDAFVGVLSGGVRWEAGVSFVRPGFRRGSKALKPQCLLPAALACFPPCPPSSLYKGPPCLPAAPGAAPVWAPPRAPARGRRPRMAQSRRGGGPPCARVVSGQGADSWCRAPGQTKNPAIAAKPVQTPSKTPVKRPPGCTSPAPRTRAAAPGRSPDPAASPAAP